MAGGSVPAGSRAGGSVGSVAEREQLDPIDVAVTPSRRVLVTGASGFIGSHLLPRLVSRGHRVRAMWRGREGPGRESAPGVEWLEADVTRPDTLARATFECDVVVHLAGCSSSESGVGLEPVNVAGTRNVLLAALEAKVGRCVYVSALGASPAAGPYSRSRFEAEDAVMSSGIEYVILRPCVVYGPLGPFRYGHRASPPQVARSFRCSRWDVPSAAARRGGHGGCPHPVRRARRRGRRSVRDRRP